MDYSIVVRDIINNYLAQEFPDFSIKQEEQTDSYCFYVTNSDERYCLRVMFTALETDDETQILQQFEQFSVVNTMRSLGEFPVVLTESGCIFGSP